MFAPSDGACTSLPRVAFSSVFMSSSFWPRLQTSSLLRKFVAALSQFASGFADIDVCVAVHKQLWSAQFTVAPTSLATFPHGPSVFLKVLSRVACPFLPNGSGDHLLMDRCPLPLRCKTSTLTSVAKLVGWNILEHLSGTSDIHGHP